MALPLSSARTTPKLSTKYSLLEQCRLGSLASRRKAQTAARPSLTPMCSEYSSGAAYTTRKRASRISEGTSGNPTACFHPRSEGFSQAVCGNVISSRPSRALARGGHSEGSSRRYLHLSFHLPACATTSRGTKASVTPIPDADASVATTSLAHGRDRGDWRWMQRTAISQHS